MEQIVHDWNNAKWICPAKAMGEICPTYVIHFSLEKPVRSAALYVTAMGNYRAELNGRKISDAVLMPGWTSYRNRLQYQAYDISNQILEENLLQISVGRGWYRSHIAGWMLLPEEEKQRLENQPGGLIAELVIEYSDGTIQSIPTNEKWEVSESMIRFSNLYDGETADASVEPICLSNAVEFSGPSHTLIPQEGPWIKEQEHIAAKSIFVTPKGETVIDFGQIVTGYVSLKLTANCGDLVEISHAEILDQDGNFYTENYRSAKAKLKYVCKEGEQSYHPWFTFFGFRYIRLDTFPGVPNLENFTAIAVHSDMKRTGHLRSSNKLLNQLFENVNWGLKGNFLDVPTDCPQRDERLGWTGDAQAYVKTACYMYDVEQFFTKWLADMALDQHPNGAVPHIIPAVPWLGAGSAAWADAATICPWQIYQFYGDPAILRKQFVCMKQHLAYIASATTETYLWTGDEHFGDWLGIDAPAGSYKGASNEDLIASAFYAYSTELVIKAGKVLGEDVSEYEKLYENIIRRFRDVFPEYKTQTEMVLVAHFRLVEDPQKVADQLAEAVKNAGVQLQTGFVGTPYLLHVLSDFGYLDLAYALLLRTEYPSWLYPVTQGATTIWEHWDGKKPDGSFWSADMNSFNHYAYGAVVDWVYEKASGIQVIEDAPGFEKVRIAPKPGKDLQWLEASVKTRRGDVRVYWCHMENGVRYDISVPVSAMICLEGKSMWVEPGDYVFYTRDNG